MIEELEDRGTVSQEDAGPIQQATPLDPVDLYRTNTLPSHRIGLSPPVPFTLAPGEMYIEAPQSLTENPRMWLGTRKVAGSDISGAMVVLIDNIGSVEAVATPGALAVSDDGHLNVTVTGTITPGVAVEVCMFAAPYAALTQADNLMLAPYTPADIVTHPGTFTAVLQCPLAYAGNTGVGIQARQRHQPTSVVGSTYVVNVPT